MTRSLVVDKEAVEEADAQARYYVERAGARVASRFAAEVEAIYRGLADRRLIGVNHPRARFRLPIKRVLLDRFPFAVVFYVENNDDIERVHVVGSKRCASGPATGARDCTVGDAQ